MAHEFAPSMISGQASVRGNSNFNSAATSIFEVIANYAAHQPDRPAILAPGFAAISYRELAAQIDRIGKVLAEAGIGKHSRVGLALPGGPEAAIITVAIASKAICVPLNPTLSRAE